MGSQLLMFTATCHNEHAPILRPILTQCTANCRGTIGENIDTPHQVFLADLGVETDESHKLAVSEFQQLAAKRPRQ